HLEAEADAEERAIVQHVAHGVDEAAFDEAFHAVGHGALPREHDAVGSANDARLRGHDDVLVRRDVRKRLRDGAKVAHAVVDHHDHRRLVPGYKLPLVEGMDSAARGSIATAMRNARPNALN